MDLLLTNYCNLDCNYCYANNVKEESQYKNMEIGTVNALLEFAERSQLSDIGLSGGEPLLHPNFIKILNIITNKPFIRFVRVDTNGLLLTKDILHRIMYPEKVVFNINLNPKEVIGEEQYTKTVDNLRYLAEFSISLRTMQNHSLHVNLTKKMKDTNYITALAGELRFARISYTVAIECDPLASAEDYLDLKNVVTKFINNCFDLKIRSFPVCSSIPLCAFSQKELVRLAITNDLLPIKKACEPILCISSDLKASFCQGLRNVSLKLNLEDKSENLDQIKFRLINQKKRIIAGRLFSKCYVCPIDSGSGICGGCYQLAKAFPAQLKENKVC